MTRTNNALFILFLFASLLVATACIFIAMPNGTSVEAINLPENPKELTAPAPVRVYVAENGSVRRTENGLIYCDDIPLSDGWQCYTQDVCKRYGVDYCLMLGLMETESSFREDADSGWAYGLCQIGYINEDELASLGMNIYTNEGNIEAGCYLLSDLLSRHSVSESLMAYNMGEYGAEELWEQGITESQYSRDVLLAAEKWKKILR